MSGETEQQVSGWTTDTLKAYLESRLEGIQREVKVAFDAAQLAVAKAETATEKRFESVNEFRAQLSDQTVGFMPREVVEPRLTAVEAFQAKLVGALALVGVFVPLATGLVVYLLTKHP